MKRLSSTIASVERENKRKMNENVLYKPISFYLLRKILQFAGTKIEIHSQADLFKMYGKYPLTTVEIVFDAVHLHANIPISDDVTELIIDVVRNQHIIDFPSIIPRNLKYFTLNYNELSLKSDLLPEILNNLPSHLDRLSLINVNDHFPSLLEKKYVPFLEYLAKFTQLSSLELCGDFRKTELVFPSTLKCLKISFKTNRKTEYFGSFRELKSLTLEQTSYGQDFGIYIKPLFALFTNAVSELDRLTLHYQSLNMNILGFVPLAVKHLCLLCYSRNPKEAAASGRCAIEGIAAHMRFHQLITLEVNHVENDMQEMLTLLAKHQPHIQRLIVYKLRLDQKTAKWLQRLPNLKSLTVKEGLIFKRGVRFLCDHGIHLSLLGCTLNEDDGDLLNCIQEKNVEYEENLIKSVRITKTQIESIREQMRRRV
jgi:hypothetical protein